jgi:CRISPR system Cascade subunit CasE
MYFSLIQPSPSHEREAAHQRAQGPYEEHQWLWKQFFPAPPGTPRDFLFRRLDGGASPRFYVVSAREARADVPGWQVKPQPYAPKIAAGERLRFDLRANPVVSRLGAALENSDGSPRLRSSGKHAGKPKHKVLRHDVVMDAKRRLLVERGLGRWQDWRGADKPPMYEVVRNACTAWMRKQAEEHGFEVYEPSLSVDGYTQHRGKDERLRFSSVDFSGELTVLNAEKFAKVLTAGIGHAKAFGCGLLLVRRAA